VKLFRSNLHQHRDYKNHTENCRSDQIAGTYGFGRRFAKPRHGDSIATGLAERGRQDLNDPEEERYLRYLCNEVGFPFVHFCSPLLIIFATDNRGRRCDSDNRTLLFGA
jgi:hypothetical protein